MKLKLIQGVSLTLISSYLIVQGGASYLRAAGIIVAYLLLMGAWFHRKSRQQHPDFDRLTALFTGLSVIGFMLIVPFSPPLILILASDAARLPLFGLYLFFLGACWLWSALDNRYGWSDKVLNRKRNSSQAAE